MAVRSVIQPLVVDRAAKKHYCRFNKKHVILKGEKRLKIKVGRSYQTYCAACAETFVTNGIMALTAVLTELDVREVS